MIDDAKKNDGYIVIAQQEYAKLYNPQYVELTTLKKKVNPNENNAAYLEATLKKHYPNMYKDMIKNDYIITTSGRIQQSLDNTPYHGTAELQHKKNANGMPI